MGLVTICFGNTNVKVCFSKTKYKTAVSYCRGTQDGCTPLSGGTYYTECVGFNVGCKLYKLESGTYVPVKNGWYSNGIIALYAINGVLQNPSYTCPRFFRLDWIKDCLAKENLSGTYYVSVTDDNTWVPDTDKVYRLYIPLAVNSDCNEVFSNDYYAFRFLNTTPVYNIGNANYLEARLADVVDTYKLPNIFQDRCKTKLIT